MARIAVGGLHHETNSFAPQRADYEAFLATDGWPGLARGEALLEATAGINLPVSGFVEEARRQGHTVVPLLWANACPSGPVTEDAFERIAGMMQDDLARALPVDGLFLDLHGAMVTEHLDDGEGELLARVRRLIGEVPLVAALDLHANVGAAMVAAADRLVAYRSYPHVDLADTGARVAGLLDRLLQGAPRGGKALRRPPFLIPLPWQCTTIEPARGLYARLTELERPDGAALSFCMGFPAADVPDCGPAVLAYGDDQASADALADALAAAVEAAEAGFAGRLWAPAEAVREAMRLPPGRPVVLADTQDNPGGGGSGDTTGLLEALVRGGAERAVLGVLHDPEAAARAWQAGAGARLEGLALGGRHGPEGVRPLVVDARVESLGEGRFTATGPMYRGSRMDLGPMARLRLLAPEGDGVEVAVASRRLQAADRAIFRHLGVEPAAMRILALKSSVHFRADFEALASAVLVVEAAGWVAADPAKLPFRRLRSGLRRAPRYRAASP